MTYSSAIFSSPDQKLQDAQLEKYRSIARNLELKPGQHVLEIGSGWGGFAEVAAKEFGARVTSVTISDAQHAYATQRMADAGLSDRVQIVMSDYRDIAGQFDAVASIEMFEAVGEQYWSGYFEKIAQVLKPGGKAALQIITIDDKYFEEYRRRADFIQIYIFRVACCRRLVACGRNRARRHVVHDRCDVRQILRAHAARMGQAVRHVAGQDQGREVRRTVPPPVVVLSRLLRSWL